MIEITQIKIPVTDVKRTEEQTRTLLLKKAAGCLRVAKEQITSLRILRHALDARKKSALSDVYSVAVTLQDKRGKQLKGKAEAQFVRRLSRRDVTPAKETAFRIPSVQAPPEEADRPVIVGSGPAGLLCAYALAKGGYRPVLLERGKGVEERNRDVARFFSDGELRPESNIQFGEGGAGTFSDGKLYTGSKDREGLFTEVKRIFTEHGAPEDILYESNPHIGTDRLCGMVARIRDAVLDCGGEVHFATGMTGLLLRDAEASGTRAVRGVVCAEREILSNRVVLAIGHSARDTVRMLLQSGVQLEPKPFAVGLRIIHPQSLVNEAMYGKGYPAHLEAASYKQAVKTAPGRSVYTFCMCPGGFVVNASSEENALCVNGMSYRDRAGAYANSAVICAVSPDDYLSYGEGASDPLAGIRFQEMLEQKAFQTGEGVIPVQTLGAFFDGLVDAEADRASCHMDIAGALKGAYRFAPVHTILPEFIRDSIAEGIRLIGEKIPGFDDPGALLCGVESRTSSPVRMVRDEGLQAVGIRGLYPCGEGAGYAGGILSSAADGLRVARALAEGLQG